MNKLKEEKNNKNQQKTNRKNLIKKRWRDIAFYSVLAAAIVKILIIPLFAKALGLMPINSLVEIASLLLIAAASVVGIFCGLGLWRKSHPWPWSRLFIAHPPLWLAMLLGFVWVTLPYPDCLYAFLITTLLIIVFLALGQDQVLKPVEKPEFKSTDISQWEPEKLLQWAKAELPVQADTPLLFGREQYVLRIFDRLYSPKDDLTRKPKSLALLGELGSGKSSVIYALVKAFQKNDWLIVKVDAWGREASNLDEQILELVIGELAKVVDVTGYKKIPSAYHDALKSHGGWWSLASHLVSGQANTTDKLQRIDDLLLIIDKQILLVIEDPDRGVAADKEKRCQRIFSLLDRLQQLEGNRIKVVVTGAKDLLSGDLRVIEFKEELDDPAKAYADILNAFVNSVWDFEPMGIIWANGKPVFKTLDFPFGTPRDFKHVIRDVDALWRNGELCGEIDLKELVLLSFLKEVSFRNPESQMFEYLKIWLNEKLSSVRRHYNWNGNSGVWMNPELLYKQNEQKSNASIEAIKQRLEVVEAVIIAPKIEPKKSSKEIWKRLSLDDQRAVEAVCNQVLGGGTGRMLQSVKCGDRVDYLDRFRNRSTQGVDSVDVGVNNLLPDEKLSDQTYLRAMANIYEALTSGNPLMDKDVTKLIYAGQLSPYLYSRMNGQALIKYQEDTKRLGPKCWSVLANKIIVLMPALPYSPNDAGHPAGRHLDEIVSFLVNSADESLKHAGEEIVLNALTAHSEAGGDLLGLHSPLQQYFNQSSSNKERMWEFYCTALDNHQITPADLSNPSRVNWNFVLGLQSAFSNPDEFLLKELRSVVYESGNNLSEKDVSAIKRAIQLFEILEGFGEPSREERMNHEYLVKYSDQFRSTLGREKWIETLKAFLSAKN